jgi:hypothetical protein
MDFDFALPWRTAGEAIALVAAFGGYGTWRVRREPATPYLRGVEVSAAVSQV